MRDGEREKTCKYSVRENIFERSTVYLSPLESSRVKGASFAITCVFVCV